MFLEIFIPHKCYYIKKMDAINAHLTSSITTEIILLRYKTEHKTLKGSA